MKIDKYFRFQYHNEISKLLNETTLSMSDKTKIYLIKENCRECSFFYIIDDLYKLVKNNINLLKELGVENGDDLLLYKDYIFLKDTRVIFESLCKFNMNEIILPFTLTLIAGLSTMIGTIFIFFIII